MCIKMLCIYLKTSYFMKRYVQTYYGLYLGIKLLFIIYVLIILILDRYLMQ